MNNELTTAVKSELENLYGKVMSSDDMKKARALEIYLSEVCK
jgi:hypothetical protein